MIDLRELLLLAGIPDGKVGGAVAAISALFLVLRAITNSPMFVHVQAGDVMVPVPEIMVAEVKAVAATVRAEEPVA